MSEKLYKIGEAAALLELKAYVLRFWETEFPQLIPVRTDKGQRMYSEDNIRLLRRIKHLLHEQGLTIEGARRALATGASPLENQDFSQPESRETTLSSRAEMEYVSPGGEPETAPLLREDLVGEFSGLDPAVLDEVIDGLEEVRRLLLSR